MMENLTKQINSFLSTLVTAYDRQGRAVKVLIPALFLLAFCCLCSLMIPLLPSRNPSNIPPSPTVLPADGTQVTPTALFHFSTFTPFPTSTAFVPSAFPSLTPSPTGSPTPTQSVPTGTATTIPSATASLVPTATNPLPTATATSVRSVEIIAVNKPAEYAEIQNLGQAPVDLAGWRLVSETGNQSCNLRGTLAPNEVLRIWARRGNPGFDCRFPNDIWRDNVADPAVLYNAQGQEVSRFP
jgi:lamin tail-like protein